VKPLVAEEWERGIRQEKRKEGYYKKNQIGVIYISNEEDDDDQDLEAEEGDDHWLWGYDPFDHITYLSWKRAMQVGCWNKFTACGASKNVRTLGFSQRQWWLVTKEAHQKCDPTGLIDQLLLIIMIENSASSFRFPISKHANHSEQRTTLQETQHRSHTIPLNLSPTVQSISEQSWNHNKMHRTLVIPQAASSKY
jgi:hypothetical protein